MVQVPNAEYEEEKQAREAKDKKKETTYLGEGSAQFHRISPLHSFFP